MPTVRCLCTARCSFPAEELVLLGEDAVEAVPRGVATIPGFLPRLHTAELASVTGPEVEYLYVLDHLHPCPCLNIVSKEILVLAS